MASLKNDFDTHFEHLLEKLNTLTGEILLKCLGDNPKKTEKDKVSSYFVELQFEAVDKVKELRRFQDALNARCTAVHIKIGYADLSDPQCPKGHLVGGRFRGTIDMPPSTTSCQVNGTNPVKFRDR